MSHRIEVAIGLITAAVGAIGIGFAVFGPATFNTNPLAAATTSIWDQGLDGNSVMYLIVMLLAALAVPVGAYMQCHAYATGGALVLWVSALVLFLGAALTIPGNTTAVVSSVLHTDTPDSVGIGIYFVPAVLMAVATGVVGMVMRHTPARPVAMRPH